VVKIAKKKKELKPVIEKIDFPVSNRQVLNDIEDSEIILEDSETSDSFFKSIINKLFSKDNIELKTEYRNVTENFAGTKLTFLARHGNIPYLEEFIEIFEHKRVSLERKGRKEIIMALEKREEEVKRMQENKLKSLIGI